MVIICQQLNSKQLTGMNVNSYCRRSHNSLALWMTFSLDTMISLCSLAFSVTMFWLQTAVTELAVITKKDKIESYYAIYYVPCLGWHIYTSLKSKKWCSSLAMHSNYIQLNYQTFWFSNLYYCQNIQKACEKLCSCLINKSELILLESKWFWKI